MTFVKTVGLFFSGQEEPEVSWPGMQIEECRLQIADCRLQIADFRLQILDWRSEIATPRNCVNSNSSLILKSEIFCCKIIFSQTCWTFCLSFSENSFFISCLALLWFLFFFVVDKSMKHKSISYIMNRTAGY